jgi:hypothetical protein
MIVWPHLSLYFKDFHLDGAGRPTRKVKMMRQTFKKVQFGHLRSIGATMVELPYKGNRIVMQVLSRYCPFSITC